MKSIYVTRASYGPNGKRFKWDYHKSHLSLPKTVEGGYYTIRVIIPYKFD